MYARNGYDGDSETVKVEYQKFISGGGCFLLSLPSFYSLLEMAPQIQLRILAKCRFSPSRGEDLQPPDTLHGL